MKTGRRGTNNFSLELVNKVAGEVHARFCSGNLKGTYGIY
jgi:hypothetical protein